MKSVLLPGAPDLMIKLQLPLIKERLRDRKNQIGTGDRSEKSLCVNLCLFGYFLQNLTT